MLLSQIEARQTAQVYFCAPNMQMAHVLDMPNYWTLSTLKFPL